MRLAPFLFLSAATGAASLMLTACGSSTDQTPQASATEQIATSAVLTTGPEVAEAVPVPPTTNPTAIGSSVPPPETTVPGTAAASSEPDDTETLDSSVAQLISQLTGQPAQQADVECISTKITAEDLELTATGANTDTPAFRKVFGVIFGCNPQGLADTFAKQTFDNIDAMTELQRTCVGTGLVDTIAASPDIISAISSDAASPPVEFVQGATEAVKNCVPPGPIQDALLAEIPEN
jgi:hypothetical protein